MLARKIVASSPDSHRNGGYIKRHPPYGAPIFLRRVDNAKLVHTKQQANKFICCVAFFYWFRLYAESLDSLRLPFGPACGCYYASLRISLLAQKVTKEKARPASEFRCA